MQYWSAPRLDAAWRIPFSCTFDSMATMVLDGRVSKTVSWFDNSWAYSHRVIDLIEFFVDLHLEVA